MKQTEKHKNLSGSPQKNCPWMTKINNEATFQNVTAVFRPATLLSGGQTKYMYKVTQHFTPHDMPSLA